MSDRLGNWSIALSVSAIFAFAIGLSQYIGVALLSGASTPSAATLLSARSTAQSNYLSGLARVRVEQLRVDVRPRLFPAKWKGRCPVCEDYWLPGYLVGYVSSPYEVDDFVVCHGCAYAAMDEEDERRFLDEW